MSEEQRIADYWAEWVAEPDNSEERLRSYTLSIVDAAQHAGQEGNWNQLRRLERLYAAGAPYCREEPLLSAYETGDFHICLFVADGSFIAGDFKQAWDLASGVLESLEVADRRRTRLSLEARPNSELRTIAIGIKAACFSEDPTLTTPEAMKGAIDCFWNISDKFWQRIQRSHLRDDIQEAAHNLAVNELDVVKAALRLNAETATKSVDIFNSHHGEHLFIERLHFKRLSQEETPSAWYWDFELEKLRQDPQSLAEDRDYCAQNRLAAARLTFGSSTLKLLTRRWRSDN